MILQETKEVIHVRKPLLSYVGKIGIFLWRFIKFIVFFGSILGLAWWLSQKPSNLRNWVGEDSVPPTITWSGNLVTIQNIRDLQWKTDEDFTPNYLTKTYNIDDISSVSYIITEFSDWKGPAHTMLSFSFSGGENVVISAELRKEKGEKFDPIKGILNQYELQYVIATEEDVIKLRTNYRKNPVYMYPIKAEKEDIRELFRSMIIRANKLQKEPEFYNTLWNNCTTNILAHVNSLRKQKIGWTNDLILPANSDEIAYKLGLINTNLSLADAREYYRIDESARKTDEKADFSLSIRKPIK